MINSTSSSASSPFDLASSSSNKAGVPTPDDSSSSFADVLQQHESSSVETSSPDAPASGTSPDLHVPTSGAPHGSVAPREETGPTVRSSRTASVPESLSVKYAVHLTGANPELEDAEGLASSSDPFSLTGSAAPGAGGKNFGIMGVAQAAKSSVPKAASSGQKTALGTAAATAKTSDLSVLLAQATILAASPAPAAATTPMTTTALFDNVSKGAVKVPADASSPTLGETISALTALATKPGNSLPLSGASSTAMPSPSKEKKSAAILPERSFLQSDSSSPVGTPTTSSVAGDLSLPVLKASDNQSTKPEVGEKIGFLAGALGNSSQPTGTTNVETKGTMNMDLNSALLNGHGSTSLLEQAPADIHIQLSSNADFDHALQQVVQVAETTNSSSTAGPLRVAMELQTPPGAVVNVYISRHDDQYRAQLSTNDPQALSWVQDKIESLRQSGDLPVNVHWLPAQTESSSISTSSSEQHTWDGDSREQSSRQSAEEDSRQNSQQKRNPFFNLDEPFMSTLEVLGRAA